MDLGGGEDNKGLRSKASLGLARAQKRCSAFGDGRRPREDAPRAAGRSHWCLVLEREMDRDQNSALGRCPTGVQGGGS